MFIFIVIYVCLLIVLEAFFVSSEKKEKRIVLGSKTEEFLIDIQHNLQFSDHEDDD